MSTIVGAWDVSLKTPIGTLAVEYRFEQAGDGLRGTARGKDETVPVEGIVTRAAENGGTRVTWHQKVTRPMRLNLDFDVVVDGDELSGHSRAGRLPRTRVRGVRSAS